MSLARTTRNLAAGVTAAVLVVACGGDDPTATATAESSVPLDTASTDTTATPSESPVSVVDLQHQVDELCDIGQYAGLPPAEGTPESVAARLAFFDGVASSVPPVESLEVPPALASGFDLVLAASTSASGALQAAEQAAAAGDVAAAERNITRHIAHLRSGAGRFALMGLECGLADPARAAAADLNVPLDLHAEQLNVGFGSVWVSQKFGDNVVRVDPVSGEILATIDVGTEPLKLQPADRRMWVRTLRAFVAIDPTTNTVVATLPKADVGPATTRNFAIDGAMWICDGRRLHRYDPTTLESVATVDIGVQCDFVYATPDLVMAWNSNEDPSESGESATAMIDPRTNQVLATISLPIDVIWPAVLEDTVYFGGQLNNGAVLIDRETWTVTSTIELPDAVGGGGITTDGTSIFVPTHGEEPRDVLVLDADTYEVVDTIETLNVNGVAVDGGALWVTDPHTNVLQRFDIER